jgi:ParB-like chromosome segregation protein Spo0J
MGANAPQPKPDSAKTQAEGLTRAATRQPQSAGQQAQPPADGFVLERSKKSLQQVAFAKIVVQEEDYSFREGGGSNPFSRTALQSLREKIKEQGGVHVPILLRDRGDGTSLLVDGHRRYFSIKQLIEEKVAGFAPDMLVPANVLATKTSELVMITTGLSANVDRQPLAFEGRLKATRKLHELGMPIKSIAQVLNVGESTVDRDLKLAIDDEMMAYVRAHCIQATNAASLLASAEKHDRRDDLMAHFKAWLEATKAQIAADVAVLKAQDADMSVPVSKTWPQSRLTPQLVKHWRFALEKNQPLVDPGFRFRALVRSDGGVQRIEVDGLNKVVDNMSAGDIAKVLQRCMDLASTLEPVLTSKMAKESQKEDADEAGEKASPGQQRLQQLGWAQFASGQDDEPDYDLDDPSIYEPNENPVDESIDPEYGPM